MFDTVIAGGRVIDPLNGIDAVTDIAISGQKICEIGLDLSEWARNVVNAKGKLVVPGLVDIHCHVFGQGGLLAVDPLCGVGAGVTTVVDAGSSVPEDIAYLNETVVKTTASGIYALLTNHEWPDGYKQISSTGVIYDKEFADAFNEFPDLIRGVKVALTPSIVEMYGLGALKSARTLCDEFGLRVMLHVGDIGNPSIAPTTVSVTSDAIDLLAPGDVLTHLYTPLLGGPLDANGVLLPAIKKAQDRGVVMDGAKGDYGFSWAVARKLEGKGINVDTVSSDLELYSLGGTAGGLMVENRRATGSRVRSESSLLEYLAFFLALGHPLNEVIAMCTSRAASAMGLQDIAGCLTIGHPGDIAILREVDGEYALTDVLGETVIGGQALVPELTVKAGRVHRVSDGPHDWGFEPPRAA